MWREVQITKPLFIQYLPAYRYSLHFRAKCLLNTLFKKAPNLCSSLNAHTMFHSGMKQQAKLKLGVFLVFVLLDSKREDKDFGTNDSGLFWT
jgi:hypothetical protein